MNLTQHIKKHLHDTDKSFLLQIKRSVHASNKPLDAYFQEKQSLNVTEVVFSNNPVLQMSPQTKRKETEQNISDTSLILHVLVFHKKGDQSRFLRVFVIFSAEEILFISPGGLVA